VDRSRWLSRVNWAKRTHRQPDAYASFSQFLSALEKAGGVKRIAIPASTDLAIAEWAAREMKAPGAGKALLFEQSSWLS